MTTRAHPHPLDAYRAAKLGEPMFVLAASDELAPLLTNLWIAIKEKGGGVALLAALAEIAAVAPDVNCSKAQLEYALRVTEAMEAYRLGHPYCRVCLCTEIIPCQLSNGHFCKLDSALDPGDALTAVCSNPECRHAAKNKPRIIRGEPLYRGLKR